MPLNSSSKRTTSPIPWSDDDLPASPKKTPLKGKSRRKDPSPLAESEAADTDGDDTVPSDGSEGANDSDVEFIDDSALMETDGEEDPPLGIIPKKKKKIASTPKAKAIVESTKSAKKAISKGASSRGASAKTKDRGQTGDSSDVEVVIKKGRSVKAATKAKPVKKVAGNKKTVIELSESEDGAQLKDLSLDADDSMYPEPLASQKIVSKKRALVTTPPLRTRAAASQAEAPIESPTKKARVAVEPPRTPRKKGSQSPSKLKAKLDANDEGSDDDNPFQDSDPLLVKPEVYLSDLTTLTVKSLPDVCEVDDENLHDRLLAERGLYSDLPNLLQCELKTAGPKLYTGRNQGRFMFSAWPNVCPDIKLKTALNAITFANDERYVNPSRVSPLLLEARLLNGNNRYELTVQGQTAVCVSLIFSSESFIYETPQNLKLPFHAIKGCFHSMEHERFGGTMGMVTGQQVLGMQIWNDIVTFQTKLNDVSSTYTSSSLTRIADRLPADCFNTYTSPVKGKAAASIVAPSTVLSALDFAQPIPVYDGRKLKDNFKWSANVFDQMGAHLPRWEKEIPKFSCVVVGYIVHFTAGSGSSEWKMYNNIQWAIVLATPPTAPA